MSVRAVHCWTRPRRASRRDAAIARAGGGAPLGACLVLCVVFVSMASFAAGAEPPPLLLRDMQGVEHDVDAVLDRGRTVTLLFWQTWCTSCKREAPHVVEAAAANQDAIAFFGVVAGPDGAVNEAKLRATVSAWGFRFPQIRDPDLDLVRRYHAFGTPVVVILGPERRVLYRGYRLPADWSRYRGRAGSTGAPPPSGS